MYKYFRHDVIKALLKMYCVYCGVTLWS